MIELAVPVESIPYIRTIEGRKFHNGKWLFPDNAIEILQKYNLINNDYQIKQKETIKYHLSPFLY